MCAQNSIRLLLVDDHPLMRGGIAFVVQSQNDMEVVAEAQNGHEAVDAFRKFHPDVTLMDLQMPGMNGIEAMNAIRSECPSARIIILTTYSGDIQASQAFRRGASGYFLKGAPQAELIGVIRSVHSGATHVPVAIAGAIAQHIGSQPLTSREIDVLKGVASGCSNKGIADNLDLAEETVKGQTKNILFKLQANDRTHAVLIALKRGYLLDHL